MRVNSTWGLPYVGNCLKICRFGAAILSLRICSTAKIFPLPSPPCARTHSTTPRFLIRRKTLGNPTCPSSSSTSWPKAYGGEARGGEDDDDDDTAAEPPTLGRLGSGSRTSSLYMSCLSSARSSKVMMRLCHGSIVLSCLSISRHSLAVDVFLCIVFGPARVCS